MKKILPKLKKRQKPQAPYAHIDWQKAATLFQVPLPKSKESEIYPKVKDVLHILAMVGAVGLTFAFPGAARAIGSIFLGEKQYSRWGTNKIFSQLERQKYISVKENADGTTTVKITQRGLTRALTYRLSDLHLQKPARWDKKWRVVIFDIPEKYRRLRDVFRMRLGQLGLYALQESVYVSPYPCGKEIEFLRELYGVAFDVRYLLVEKIENDEELKSHFEL